MKTPANTYTPKSEEELARMQGHVQALMEGVLSVLDIDPNDPNVSDTPRRWAKMIVREAMAGRFSPPPSCTTFPNTTSVDEIITVGPITVRSMCSHHFVPIMGQCWIGILPSERLLGLSKYARLAHWVFARPQIQEEAAMQLADAIEDAMQPRGVGVIVRAQHLCMTWRGVKEEQSLMGSSVMRGVFRDNEGARSELMRLLTGKGM